MKYSEKYALFGPGKHFSDSSTAVASNLITVSISPIHAHAVIFPTTVMGDSDLATAALLFRSSGTAGFTEIGRHEVGNSPFSLTFEDLRSVSGQTLVISLGATTAGTLCVIGNQQIPFGCSSSAPEWV